MASVEVERDGAIERIWLNRPERRNALRPSDVALLLTALRDAQDAPSVRCVLIAGRGGSLCAGGDLSDDVASGALSADAQVEAYQAVLSTIVRLRQPVVAVLEGAAVGAGVALALAADVCIAARSSRLILPWIARGLVPDMGVPMMLARRIGAARTKACLLSGASISGSDAAAWGLVLEAAEDPWAAATDWAHRLCSGPPVATALTKRLVNQSSFSGLDRYLDLERSCMAASFGTPEPAEGMAAFNDRRPPDFSGTSSSGHHPAIDS